MITHVKRDNSIKLIRNKIGDRQLQIIELLRTQTMRNVDIVKVLYKKVDELTRNKVNNSIQPLIKGEILIKTKEGFTINPEIDIDIILYGSKVRTGSNYNYAKIPVIIYEELTNTQKYKETRKITCKIYNLTKKISIYDTFSVERSRIDLDTNQYECGDIILFEPKTRDFNKHL